MKKVKSEMVQMFIGKIGDKILYNEEVYIITVYLIDMLCNKLKNIIIPKEDDLIDDFIDSIGNIYRSSDATLTDISDAIESTINNFVPTTETLKDLKFHMYDNFIDDKITHKYFDFINNRLKSDYYLTA